MELIRTTKQIGQAVKNVHRLRQIITVLSKKGFDDLLERMQLGKYRIHRGNLDEKEERKSVPHRLREACEELGPTFVKLGQILSTRPDVLPQNFVDEFVLLQDNVQPLPFAIIKQTIESELKATLETLFLTFDERPLASASIGQVHRATLNTGEQVVVKVQRPDIKKTIENDISLLSFLAKALEKYVPETKVASPSVFVEEFFRTISQELDFKIEANNMTKISENMENFPEIVIPKVYRAYSTHLVLTMDFIDGVRVNDAKAMLAAGIDSKEIVKVGARAFFRSVLIDGIFHGDLHAGNLFALPGNRLGIIDFGIVGRLSQKARDQLVTMVMALLSEDYETLCYQYAELGVASSSIDFEGFQRETRNALSPYVGLNISEVNAGKVLIEATRIATKYDIRIPADWMIVFRAILTTESMGRSLDPEFDLIEIGQDLIRDLVKDQYSIQRITKETVWILKDVLSLLQVLPRQIRWMFRKFNSNDFAFDIHIPELKIIRKQMQASARKLNFSIVIAALIIASSLSLPHNNEQLLLGQPSFFISYILAAIVLFLVSVFF